MKQVRSATALLATLLLFANHSAHAQSPPSGVKLAMLIIVDQMCSDYLVRFDSLYTGGLARLYKDGHVFLNGQHSHSCTETAVGCATIASGKFPRSHGMVGNYWYDRENKKSVYCVSDSTAQVSGHPELPGRSPINLKRGGIADWLNRSQPDAKVYSVAAKDRAAILMGSYSNDGVYWYNKEDGTFVTSLFYSAVYPEWAASFNAGRPADNYYQGVWDRIAPLRDYRFSGPDSVTAENDGKNVTFPHIFSPGPKDDPNEYYSNLLSTPFADHLTLRFARELVSNEGLGRDSVVDLLLLSCSAADYVGHAYGPQSHEVQDYYLRLDRYLGEFFAFLDSTVRMNCYCIALSSDHGVLELPELLKTKGIDAGRIPPDSLDSAIVQAGVSVSEDLSLAGNPITLYYGDIYLNYEEATAAGISNAQLQDSIAAKLKKIKYIEDVFTADELISSASSSKEYFELYRNNYFDGRSPDVMYRVKENYLVSSWKTGTTHGSCYLYDTTVPIIFYGPGISPAKSDRQIRTVDIAPTLAEYIGITETDEYDGTSLLNLIAK